MKNPDLRYKRNWRSTVGRWYCNPVRDNLSPKDSSWFLPKLWSKSGPTRGTGTTSLPNKISELFTKVSL